MADWGSHQASVSAGREIPATALIVYRAISPRVPALAGSAAFLSLRREIGRPAAQAT